jgi:hypothetical protein
MYGNDFMACFDVSSSSYFANFNLSTTKYTPINLTSRNK